MRAALNALLARQESRYVLVGLTQLVLDWTLFVVLTLLGMPTIVANTLGRTLIAVLGFALHGRYTFGDGETRKLGWKRFARFATVWISLAACSAWAMHVVREGAGLYVAWATKPLVEILLAVVSYLLLKRWVYR